MLAEYLRRLQQQGMSTARTPITMESQVNALANQPLAPGMVSAYVDKSKPDPRAKSFAGEENRIKSQRAYADMLRGKEAPKGKTVGPYDLYMGPNWGESLAYAGEQALGGYMTGLANRDDKALDEEKGRALKATLAAEDKEKERLAALEQAKLEVEEKTLAERIANNTRSNLTAIRGQNMTQQRDVELISFFNPKAGEPGEPATLSYYVRNGRVEDMGGVEVDVQGLTPYKALSPQSLDAAGARPTAAEIEEASESEASLRNRVGRFSNLDNLATYSLEQARDFTGYNPQALAGKYGAGPQGVKAQQFNQIVSAEEVGGLLPAIKEAKLTPVSDNDVKIVREQFVNAQSQPETIAQFYAYGGRQFMSSTIEHNIGLGTITAEEGAEIQNEYDRKAATLALNWGYDPQQLVVAGMDKDLVNFLVEAKKRGDS